MKENKKLHLEDLKNDVVNSKYDVIKAKIWKTVNNDTGPRRLRLI